MKKYGLFMSVALCSTIFAGTLTVESGWNLLSVSEPASTADCILEQLPSGSVLYKYDNTNKKWLAKSNSYTLNTSFSQKGFGAATTLSSTDGFWLYNPSERREIYQSCTHQSGENDTNITSIIDATPASELTVEQKSALAYMWNEEKLAKDIYFALNEITPHQSLYNIAANSETTHEAMVEALIEKYDLNITNLTDYSGGYSADELSAFGPGQYGLPEIENLYNVLYEKGSQSLIDALQVGCMVEVTDINDLDKDIVTASGADDLVMVFSNLRSGSYNHYWAFDSALKALGVSDGCCSAGEEYCKTADEYPLPNNGHYNF